MIKAILRPLVLLFEFINRKFNCTSEQTYGQMFKQKYIHQEFNTGVKISRQIIIIIVSNNNN